MSQDKALHRITRRLIMGSASVILNAVKTTGAGTAVRVDGYNTKHVSIGVTGMTGANSVVAKVYCSDQDSEPNWDSASSVTNNYYTVDCKRLPSASDVPGDTGLTFTGSDKVVNLYVNSDGGKWVNVNVISYSGSVSTVSGTTVTAKLKAYN